MASTATLRACRIVLLAAVFLTTVSVVAESHAQDNPKVDFATEVKPILADKCFFCHGPDSEHREADMRLDMPLDADQRDWLIVAGDRDSSLVWERINDPDDPMPPLKSHKHLKPAEIEIIGKWIDQGAAYETHWAYAPVTNPAVPKVEDAGWSRGAIDRFLYERMGQHGLQPSPSETPARLLRRLYLDLIGLPPSADEVEAFVASPTEEAYARTVEKLLDDDRFGEHWAAWWLDLVRYGDSVGFHGDQPRAAWPYRDWVIHAFNDNLPFDEFTRLQLAGDLIASEATDEAAPNQDAIIASAYNRLALQTSETGAQAKEYAAIYGVDRVSNFGEVWLGSSTGCARCHDHKYDPITARDFYSLAAVFDDIDHPIVSSEKKHWVPYLFVPQDDEQAKKVRTLEKDYQRMLAEHPLAGPYESWLRSRRNIRKPKVGAWAKEFEKIVNARQGHANSIPTVSVTRALHQPRTTRLLPRGNWMDESGPVMQPRPPEFLGGKAATTGRFSRLDLANWLFQPNNPLTGRVVVNRLWSRLLGRGISSDTLDLGNQGAPPTHRELLDWLATEFRNSDWDVQFVIRKIVMSSAYRQSSNQPAELVRRDPENKWFARQSAPRLSAEVVRDQALATSGLLVQELGGPSVFPYQPAGHWKSLNFPKRKYVQSGGSGLYRRSVYTWVQRTFTHPAMMIFDFPNRESCIALRADSNTPLLALTMLNETLYVESARKLAERVMLEHSESDDRLVAMFRAVVLRPPTDGELEKLQRLLGKLKSEFSAHADQAEALCQVGDSIADASLQPVELASYTSIGRVILNLHETVTRP